MYGTSITVPVYSRIVTPAYVILAACRCSMEKIDRRSRLRRRGKRGEFVLVHWSIDYLRGEIGRDAERWKMQ